MPVGPDDDAFASPKAAGEAEEAGPAPSEHPVRPGTRPAAHAGGESGTAPRFLPLGSGLVLVGLGLALGFVGLRLRRT
ncbi:hypothetical protein [Streptomyces sp. JW3]|uniref:hypothetical protein n=1 Tax=Streptomyces sp. JW3 TaxID=3456955 RepID=UPI003FA442DE